MNVNLNEYAFDTFDLNCQVGRQACMSGLKNEPTEHRISSIPLVHSPLGLTSDAVIYYTTFFAHKDEIYRIHVTKFVVKFF
jgi:hypothetical protein